MKPQLAPHGLAIRLGALFASAVMTALIFGSQLPLHSPYASNPDSASSAARAASVAQRAACATAPGKKA